MEWLRKPADEPARTGRVHEMDACPCQTTRGTGDAGDPCQDCVRGTVEPGKSIVLFLEGPGGSGHFWTIAALVGAGKETMEFRWGTSTRGWHAVSMYSNNPLQWFRWLDDLDGDGYQEVIIWRDFLIRPGESAYEPTLLPAVFSFDGSRFVDVTKKKGRVLLAQLADVYRTVSKRLRATGKRTHHFAGIARGLDAFLMGTGCASPTPGRE